MSCPASLTECGKFDVKWNVRVIKVDEGIQITLMKCIAGYWGKDK